MIRRGFPGAFRLVLIPALLPGFGLALLARQGSASGVIDPLPLGLAVAFGFVASLVQIVLLRLGPGDAALFPLAAALSGVGIVLAERLGAEADAVGRLATRQGAAFVLGSLALTAAAGWLRLDLLRRYKYTWLAISLALMASTSVLGQEVNGARLWLSFGPLRFQPSELVKITLVVFLSAYLVDRRDLLETPWRVGRFALPPLPYLIPLGLMGGGALGVLIVQNDLGSALLLFGTFLAMFWIAIPDPRYLALAAGGFLGAAWAGASILPRVAIRAQNWIDPWVAPLSSGYQQVQSEYALAAGGLLGAGLGRGVPLLIPDAHTDFALAALGEEAGLVGASAVLTLHLLLVVRGIRIGLLARDRFHGLLAAGLTVALALQTLIIAGGVVRLLPLTGLPLPFVSYGGSSLVINLVIVGLLYRISIEGRLRPSSGSPSP